MSRRFKHEVAAVNIRIQDKSRRDYVELLSRLADLKRGVRVIGKSNIAINYFNKDSLIGVILKYDELPSADEWFDIEKFDEATQEDVSKIYIPQKLKPNYSRFYLRLIPLAPVYQYVVTTRDCYDG